jgi:hypothetical protein
MKNLVLVFSGMTSAIMAESCEGGRNRLKLAVPVTGPGEAAGDLGQLYVHFLGLFVCLFWRNSPQCSRVSSFTRFLDHTQRHTTVGRTPLDE